jgi:hypothetical protein
MLLLMTTTCSPMVTFAVIKGGQGVSVGYQAGAESGNIDLCFEVEVKI